MAGIVRSWSFLPARPGRRMRVVSRRLVFVVYPGVTPLDLVAPHEEFIAAARVARQRLSVPTGSGRTSAGGAAGMDLALALVDDDLGRDIALMTGRQLVLFVQRPGGQSRFSAQLGAQVAARDPLRDLQAWITDN